MAASRGASSPGNFAGSVPVTYSTILRLGIFFARDKVRAENRSTRSSHPLAIKLSYASVSLRVLRHFPRRKFLSPIILQHFRYLLSDKSNSLGLESCVSQRALVSVAASSFLSRKVTRLVSKTRFGGIYFANDESNDARIETIGEYRRKYSACTRVRNWYDRFATRGYV